MGKDLKPAGSHDRTERGVSGGYRIHPEKGYLMVGVHGNRIFGAGRRRPTFPDNCREYPEPGGR